MDLKYQQAYIAEEYIVQLIQMADNMASAATTFNSHGYDVFIQAREELIVALYKLIENRSSGID
jgi:hypothetical protein